MLTEPEAEFLEPQTDDTALTTDLPGILPGGSRVLSAQADLRGLSVVGVTWVAGSDAGDTVVELRTQAGGEWSEWTAQDVDAAPHAADGESVREGTAPFVAVRVDAVEARLTSPSALPEDPVLSVITTEPDSALADRGAAASRSGRTALGPAPVAVAASAAIVPPQPTVRARAAWGADERLMTWTPQVGVVRGVTVHHTAGTNAYTQDQTASVIRGIYTYHAQTLGWGDIGYNFLVDKWGRVWEGRKGGIDRAIVGAHSVPTNRVAFGVSFLGNYDEARTSTAMVDGAAAVIAWKFGIHGVSATGTLTSAGNASRNVPARVVPAVHGHRDVDSTACPGQYLYADLTALRQRVMTGGALDAATAVGTQAVRVTGWAVVGSTTAPAQVRLIVDGAVRATVAANQNRPDVQAATGRASTGFDVTLPLNPGDYRVCAAVVANGGDAALGCREVSLAGGKDYFLNDAWTGVANTTFSYGWADDRVLIGDWDGDGVDTIAVRRGHLYHINDKLLGGAASRVVAYGRPDDDVLVGDWDGDGVDTLAVRRGNVYYFKNSLAAGNADSTLTFGLETDRVVVGDWDGDGKDTLAIRRGNQYLIFDDLTASTPSRTVFFGRDTDAVVVGDWDGDGKDTLAVRRDRTYFVRNVIADGKAELELTYGREADATLVGDWNRDRKDTLGVRRP
ncbi:MAG: N-acetylmuramoyl-L-alanine amidase [Promicromonosporaceae bacterium]|nr:N-acetylmuramoyl-L-alanine amidase [Promicromonosporaceae bacterium]